MASITTQELKTLSKYIYSIAGIYLDESKGYLVESRLNPLLVAFNLSSFSELYYQAKTDPSKELEKHIIDAISTNETFFFRDNTPFDLLRFKIVPELIDAKKNRYQTGKIPISIWSAACSTGQEVYSMAISLLEVLPDRDRFEIRIFGSDISQQAINQASYGQYNKLEVGRGLPPEYLQKYFQPSGQGWRVTDFLRSMASFKAMNLMHPFGAIGPFDIIFCRNVAIYFSQADKKKLFARIARVMRPGGYLLVGGSETLSGLAPQFTSRHYLRGIYYQLKKRTAKAPKEKTGAVPARTSNASVLPSRADQAGRGEEIPSPPAQPLSQPQEQLLGPSKKPVKPQTPSGEKAFSGSKPRPESESEKAPTQPRTNTGRSGLLSSLQTKHAENKEPRNKADSDSKQSSGSLLSKLQHKRKTRFS
mgnify:CR=1 FL=1